MYNTSIYSFKKQAIAWKLGLHPANLKYDKITDFDRKFVETAVNEYTKYIKEKEKKT